jgi:6-phosphogluconolactonase
MSRYHRRYLLRLAVPGALLAPRGGGAAGKQYLVDWGTYTAGGPQYGTGESKGIYVSRFDAGTGKLTAPELAAETVNPSYLAIHPSGGYLFAVNEHIDHSGKTPGEVTAFSIDRRTGKLAEINRVSARGGMPCHIGTDKTGKVVMVANWSTGSTATFPVRGDGSLGEAKRFYQHSGEPSGPHPSGRPVQVHCHAVTVSPDYRFLIAAHTGLNKIFVHRLDVARATFTRHEPPSLGLRTPANPRHLVFHPNGRWAYVANEGSPGCTMLGYDVKPLRCFRRRHRTAPG